MLRLLDLQLLYGVAGAREQFEQLCLQLIKTVVPSAKGVRADPGDGGVDIFVGNWDDPEGIHVFQVKYFPNGVKESQKHQIRSSFQHCVNNPHFITKQWTLCLPVELSEEETAWFSRWKHEVATPPLPAERIGWWGESDLVHLLVQPGNEGIQERFFQEQHLTQLREMSGMLSRLLQEGQTRPGEAMNAFALRQDSKEATLRYKDEVYIPLHMELRALVVAFEDARGGQQSFPQWIPITGEPRPRRLRYIAPSSQGLAFDLWPAHKNDFRVFGALTASARQLLDDLGDRIRAYNGEVEQCREAVMPLLTQKCAIGLERAVQDPAYRKWKATYKEAELPPPYQAFPWFELLERNTAPEAGPLGESMASWWLGYGFQTLGWLLARNPERAAEQLYDDYERRGAMPESETWFRGVCTALCSDLVYETSYHLVMDVQERLFVLLTQIETMLLRVLIDIQYRYEGGPPPL